MQAGHGFTAVRPLWAADISFAAMALRDGVSARLRCVDRNERYSCVNLWAPFGKVEPVFCKFRDDAFLCAMCCGALMRWFELRWDSGRGWQQNHL